ncbi:type IV pilus assembly protein PilM [Rhodopirellula sp. P2]|uniref:type IV pilus assembly protein PilM n=1 Tax=Rhodopirellula sp. P2 TaxID=2127060 RepID=UPI0023683365|nr:type IV pilus assembly protein PilM [Rhodopirellula sp. P2]WDQ15517.1 type IV pilus assembly protein PilM [Rhodopirellula sp. P2]
MAGSGGVWGIEIGQSALKALHCVKQGDEIVADAFDLIEYPKILGQADADPDQLIADALDQLMQRNDAIRDRVCISVPGQSGLAKFFKPPPVELKKIHDIVKYEAKTQIPFELSDVVWDYQTMPGATIQEGYALESEVGLFAMKREQAYRQLAPFQESDIEVDMVQLTPIALYNMVAYDRFHERIENETFDPDEPPTSSVLLSIGTDSSDLIVTNGFRIWQRSMPIGGNHFTRQLTKDLKLTFAKAEHLKRNAREAVDPKLVFQTMRPVFNDLVTEVQRSIGFFRSIDKKAEITELLVTGNTVKMPGLAAYLGKNLGYEVHTLDRFNRLSGDDVLSIPTFRDNAPTFAVCYGLCLQGLGLSQIHTSLIPAEIKTERMIRAKKPWALAGMAALLLGATTQYALTQRSWQTTHEDLWSSAEAAVTSMSSYSSDQKSEDTLLVSRLTFLNRLGEEISGNAERRLVWLELINAVNAAIPRADYPDGKIPSVKELPLEDRIDFHISEIDTKFYEDLAEDWYSERLDIRYKEEMKNWYDLMRDSAPPEELADDTGPEEEGWVIQLKGYHYFNSPKHKGEEGSQHVRKYLTTNFREKPINLIDPQGNPITFTPEEFGFSYPLLLNENQPQLVQVPNPDYDPVSAMTAMQLRAEGDDDVKVESPTLEVLRLDFVFQVVWKESVLSERIEAKRLADEEAALEAEMEGEGGSTDDDLDADPNSVAIAN